MMIAGLRPSTLLAGLVLVGCGAQVDLDEDGFTVAEGDCWDEPKGPPGTGLSGAEISPAALEGWYDGYDQDCAGDSDFDADHDGFVPAEWAGSVTTDVPAATVLPAGDCDDADASVHPAASEDCGTGWDDNCDGELDASGAIGCVEYRADLDRDGFGDPALAQCTCEPVAGIYDVLASAGDDCDDSDEWVHPHAVEYCNQLDDDCDGQLDEADAVDALRWYADIDGDGFGDPSAPSDACSLPEGMTADSSDCDDRSAAIHPGAQEVCNELDDDCDALIDDEDDALEFTEADTWYADADADGFGGTALATLACAEPSGFVGNNTDCDDDNSAVNPDAQEVCGGVDDDCDGLVDDADTVTLGADDVWYADADADGFGDVLDQAAGCAAPSGYVATSTDCDDADEDVNPGAEETCRNGMDDDCDGSAATWAGADSCSVGSYELTRSERAFFAEAPRDTTGASVAFGDTSGDGLDDVAIGSPLADGGAHNGGSVALFLGSATIGDGSASGLSEADAILYGTTSSLLLGASVIANQDFDGDGFDDVVAGGPGWAPGGATTGSYGAVFALYGPATGILDADVDRDVLLSGGDYDGHTGVVLTSGDVDGDGYDDLAVGSPNMAFGMGSDAGSGAGAVDVLLSTSLTRGSEQTLEDAAFLHLEGTDANGSTGYALALSDLDGDGLAELAVGSPTVGAGQVHILDPNASITTLADADTVWSGIVAGGRAGSAVVGVGDMDGDGLDDLAVGACLAGGSSSAGTTWVMFSQPTGAASLADADVMMEGTGPSDRFGWQFAGSDFDGDGQLDLLVGEPRDDGVASNRGQALLFLGPLSAGTMAPADADANFTGDSVGGNAGSALAGGADANGDGYGDFLVGVPLDDSPGENAGAAYMLLGVGP